MGDNSPVWKMEPLIIIQTTLKMFFFNM